MDTTEEDKKIEKTEQGVIDQDILEDKNKRQEFKYVKVVNPFVLGIQIGVGILLYCLYLS
jgi:hypothetical protein|tara:strand:- start:627 stop:806 length:180 start_codon:yes stop_codon:yes gene_type:complete